MRIDNDGKLELTSRWTFKILEEFGWNVEDLADAIMGLRDEIQEKDKEIERLNKQ